MQRSRELIALQSYQHRLLGAVFSAWRAYARANRKYALRRLQQHISSATAAATATAATAVRAPRAGAAVLPPRAAQSAPTRPRAREPAQQQQEEEEEQAEGEEANLSALSLGLSSLPASRRSSIASFAAAGQEE